METCLLSWNGGHSSNPGEIIPSGLPKTHPMTNNSMVIHSATLKSTLQLNATSFSCSIQATNAGEQSYRCATRNISVMCELSIHCWYSYINYNNYVYHDKKSRIVYPRVGYKCCNDQNHLKKCWKTAKQQKLFLFWPFFIITYSIMTTRCSPEWDCDSGSNAHNVSIQILCWYQMYTQVCRPGPGLSITLWSLFHLSY